MCQPEVCRTSSSHKQYIDPNGFVAFDRGEIGQAHVRAHQLLEDGEHEAGLRFLNDFLARRAATGSEWVHLHWHAAVFAIEVGKPQEAARRYLEFIEPLVSRRAALTDAPSLLWRLALKGVNLDWESVRSVAKESSQVDGNEYVELHHALAFAGARDVQSLDSWIDDHLGRCLASGSRRREPSTLLGVALALRLFASRDFPCSAKLFEATASQVGSLGGSSAQNLIFGEIGSYAAAGGTA